MATPNQIKTAATAVKRLRLSAMDSMDEVAVRLNQEPTYEELEDAGIWARALHLAELGGSPKEIAGQLQAEGK